MQMPTQAPRRQSTSSPPTRLTPLALMAAIALTLGPAGTAVPAFAAESAADKAGTTAKPTRSPRASTRNARAAPSEESRAERDRRLQRECRGRPNAGACLGHAS